MNLVLFVTGTSGSGKTSLTRRLASMGWRVLITGDLFRNGGYADHVHENESLDAPESFDNVVMQAIKDELIDVRRCMVNLLVVDGAPRKPLQVKLLDFATTMGWHPVMLFLDANRDVRLQRLKSACMTERDVERRSRKEEVEYKSLSAMLEYCGSNGYPFHKIDTTHTVAVSSGITSQPSIQIMMACVVNLFSEMKRSKGEPPTYVPYTHKDRKHYVGRVKSELLEYVTATTSEDRTEELMDVLWFVLLLCHLDGMAPSDIFREFTSKSRINQFRRESGVKPHMDVANG